MEIVNSMETIGGEWKFEKLTFKDAAGGAHVLEVDYHVYQRGELEIIKVNLDGQDHLRDYPFWQQEATQIKNGQHFGRGFSTRVAKLLLCGSQVTGDSPNGRGVLVPSTCYTGPAAH